MYRRPVISAALGLAAFCIVAGPAGQARADTMPACTAESTAVSAYTGTGIVADCNTLLGLKDALRGTASLNWSADTAMASWNGITVSGNRVARLDLKSMGMNGSIPPALGQLTSLTLLYLYDNGLTGSIPSELGQLTSLEWLSLRSNGLTGSIPSALGQLANLKGLLLQNNGLSGSIPSELGGLKKLSSLYLDGNDLTGSIPTELGRLTRLRTLSLSGNGLSGCIPFALQGQASGINPQQGSVNLPVCVNEAPTFSSAATFSVAENETAVDTVVATDADDDDSIARYAITGGADRAQFSIDTSTGALTFASAPNYEDPRDVASTTPASAAGDNEYIVVVRATGGTDSRALTATQTIAVTVTDVDGEAPSAPSAPKVSAITSTGFTLTWAAPANAGPAITDYAVQYRADGGAWTDAGHSGTELTAAVTGLRARTGYAVRVRAINAEGASAWSSSKGTATIAAPNAAPVFGSAATFSVAENAAAVGTVTATDADARDSIAGYAITGGADRALFAITNEGDLSFTSAPDYEAPADAGTDNEYVVEVTATGGTNARALTAVQTLTVTVTDVDGEAPSAPAVPTISAATADGFTVTWTAPANSGPAILDYTVRYRVGTSGSWQRQTGVAGTSLALTGLSAATEYQVGVRARNAEGRSDWSPQATATTTAAPNAAPVFGSAATFSVAENTTTVGTVAATNADGTDSIIGYAIIGGADRAHFSIDQSSGALTFITAPDFERPTDVQSSDPANLPRNNRYIVVVTATSGSGDRALTAEQTIAVTVTDVLERPSAPATPVISAATLTGFTVTWTEPANSGPEIKFYEAFYRVAGGAWEDTGHTDTGLTVTLSGLTADTRYEVWVRAVSSEGVGPWSAIATATTMAVPNEAPVFTSAATFSVAENTTTVGTVAATDADALDSITGYAITGGADQALFGIDTNTGALTFKSAPNYEERSDANTNNIYVVKVTATGGADDRVLTATQRIAVTVTDEIERPSAPDVPTISVETADGFTVTWTEPANSGPAILDYTVRYRVGTSGPWQRQSGVSGTSLALTGLSAATEYKISVRARNAEGRSAWSPQATATTLAPNTAPVFTSAATFSVAENTTTVGTVAANDGDAQDSITGYEITGGADRALFAIDAGTGALTFISAPNYEDPQDAEPADSDYGGAYVVEVTATGGAGDRALTAEQTIAVTVTNVLERPSAPATPVISAETPDGFTVTWTPAANSGPGIEFYEAFYRVIGGAWEDTGHLDAGLTVTVSGLMAETRYEVWVRAVNGEGVGPWSAIATATTTTAPNTAPVFTSAATFSVAENTATVGTVVATDDDDGDSIGYAITGGADRALFSIDTNTGALTFISAPNYEDPQDAEPADSDYGGAYVVEVTATGGAGDRALTAEQTIAVTVTNVLERPSAPAVPVISAETPDGFTVTWTPAANSGPGIEFYEAFYRVIGGAWEDTGHLDAGLTVTVSGLMAETSYEVWVRAVNGEGVGPWSAIATATTTTAPNTAPVFTSAATFSVAENTATVGTVVATDDDDGDSIGYAITGGADRALFSIDTNTGALTFISAPNYEDPQDAEPADSDYGGAYVVEGDGDGRRGRPCADGRADDRGDGDECARAAFGPGCPGDFGGDGGRLHGDLDAGSEQRPGDRIL